MTTPLPASKIPPIKTARKRFRCYEGYNPDARGRLGGRPEIRASATKVAMAKKLYADKTTAINDICKTLNISRATLYRYIKVK